MKIWFMQALMALHKDKRGVSIIESARLAALIGIALVTSPGTLKTSISTAFPTIGNSL
jgi:Flp pilus assembly pilin Flp